MSSRVKGFESLGAGRCQHQRASQQVQNGQNLFRGEKSVGEHPDKERRNHRRQGRCAIGQTNLLPAEI